METKRAFFKAKEIRRTLHNDEWWFSVPGDVEGLTDSADPKQYVKKMRHRDKELNSYWGTICTPLVLPASDTWEKLEIETENIVVSSKNYLTGPEERNRLKK